jgi:glyoxylase I family protein
MVFLRRRVLRGLSFAFGSSFLLRRSDFGVAAGAGEERVSSQAVEKAAGEARAAAAEMEKVTGIGGFFFRAKDPKAMGLWYEQHLGILTIPKSYEEHGWQQEAGPTAFAAFSETSKYFGDAQKVWMLNFRVRDLDKMAAQLEAAGIAVKIDPQTYPNGRFAHLKDPEGNPIELWQPAKAGAAG